MTREERLAQIKREREERKARESRLQEIKSERAAAKEETTPVSSLPNIQKGTDREHSNVIDPLSFLGGRSEFDPTSLLKGELTSVGAKAEHQVATEKAADAEKTLEGLRSAQNAANMAANPATGEAIAKSAGYPSLSDLNTAVSKAEDNLRGAQTARDTAAQNYYGLKGRDAVRKVLSVEGAASLFDIAANSAAELGALTDNPNGADRSGQALMQEAAGKKYKAVEGLVARGIDRETLDAAIEYYAAQIRSGKVQEELAGMSKWANQNKVAASAVSVLSNAATGMDYVGALIGNAGHNSTKDIESYKPLSVADFQATGVTQALREGASADMGNVGKFLYNTGMSMADSALLVSTIGPGATVVMGMSAASATAKDVIDRGGTNNQALLSGLAAGVAEAAFEKFSVDNLINMSTAKNAKAFFGNVLKQAGIEATEEINTELANILMDAAIMGQNSSFNAAVQEYKAQGMTEEQAKRQAFLDNLKQVGLAGLGGFLSGGGMASVKMGGSAALESASGRYNADVGMLLQNVQAIKGNDIASAQPGQTINPIDTASTQPVQSRLSNKQVENVIRDEAAMKEMGIDTNGKTMSQLRNEVRAVMAAQEQGAVTSSEESRVQTPAAETALRSDPAVSQEEAARRMSAGEVASAVLGENGAKAFKASYNQDAASRVDEKTAATGFNTVYKAALDGRTMTAEERAQTASLPEGMRMAAESSARLDRQRASQAKYFGENAGVVRDNGFKQMHLSSKTVRTLDAAAKVAGVQVQFAEDVEGGEASYQNGVIRISTKSKDPVMTLFTHEIVHRIRETSPQSYNAMAEFVRNNLSAMSSVKLSTYFSNRYNTNDVSYFTEEMVADAFGTILQDGKAMERFVQDNRTAAQKVLDAIRDFVNAIKRAMNHQNVELSAEQRKAFRDLETQLSEMEKVMESALKSVPASLSVAPDVETAAENGDSVSALDGMKLSLKWDSKFMDAADRANNGRVSKEVMKAAREARQAVADIFNDPDLADSLGLPPDIIGNTYIPNGSYSGTEENTTVCIRSIAADDLMDAIAEYLGRPLTVEDTIAISQEYWKYTDRPECLYCYVAMDRKAHREFLGSYLQQRDDVLENIRSGMDKEDAYQKFLDGRKDTKPMRDRFEMWLRNDGKEVITPADVASYNNMEKAIERNGALKAQINDALKYAQSASWAKKRLSYAAYNNHILRWKQSRIDNLNRNYGLRLYSFSDFSPAFILENMQMLTDAAVRGLKVLAYTKELDFVRIFAKSGMNINISVFGYNDGNGGVAMDAMQGADWAEAQAMREKYPNVGCTFVATNDAQVDWALGQDWVDVIIPFHMVRTGTKVATHFGWKNYTAMSADTKADGWTSADAKHILPPMHQNDKAKYLEACEANHLTPRFNDWVDHPNYMKLVNETRMSEGDSKPVQPIFDVDAAKDSIEVMRKQGGYYTPIGGNYDTMYDIAEEIARKISAKQSKRFDPELAREVDEAVARYVEQYGAIPPGENPARVIEIPRRTERGNKVSQTVRTILEAQATPDEMVPDIEKLVADGKLSYNPISDKSAVNEATAIIERDGWDTAQRDWFKAMGKGVVSKANTTMGWLLYNNAANSGNTKLALDILNEMVKSQRSAAQALQATRILKTLSPETQLYGAQKSVEGMTAELKKRYGDDIPDLEIDPALAEKFLNARTDKGRAEAMQEIYRDIGRQMPSRFIDKFNAWRYLAMLGNPRTHVRNIVGNAGFAPVVAAKNLTAAAIERIVLRNRDSRTKSVAFATKEGRALLKAAWADYANVTESMPDGKYSDLKNANRYIEEGRVIFGRGEGKTAFGRVLSNTAGKLTEKVRRFNSGALAHEDMWFAKPNYASALAQYCKARGITVEELQKGTSKRVGVARNYAMREAQKATYQDANEFSEFFSRLGRNPSNKKTAKAMNALVEGVLPFRKTPANILVRSVEYSPLGLVRGLKNAIWDVRKGNVTAAETIDRISSGLTGTALLGIGVWLAAEGLVRGHGDDEKDKEKGFTELQGHQGYALELPDGTSITLDWLAPEALPFFIGVNLWEMTSGMQDAPKMGDILGAVSNVSEPLLEMSCLQGLNDLLDSVGYASSEGLASLPQVLISAATSLLTQIVPTLLGQIERTGESVRMTTYTDKNKFLDSDTQYFLGRVTSRIPGIDYSQIPYIDAWGREEASGGLFERAFNNFLNPAYMSEVRTSAMEQELERLYTSVGETELLPSRAPKSFTVDGEDIALTAEQYVEYASFRGQRAYDLLTELTESRRYSGLDDKLKASAVKKCYSVANEEAKALVSEFSLGKFHQSMDKAEAAGISGADYIVFYVTVSELKQDQVRAWLAKSGMTRKQQEVLWSTKYSSAY